jgi:hypothetical protein
MKGAIELNWKILVGIIAAIIAIIIVSIFVFSLVTGRNLAEGVVVLCKSFFETAFKNTPLAGAEGVCDIFTRG